MTPGGWRRFRWAAGLLLAALAAAPGPAEPPARLQQKKAELAELKAAARELVQRLERTRAREESARQAVFDLEQEIAGLRRKLRSNKQALAGVRTRLEELGTERDRLRERIRDHQQRLAAYLRAVHRSGRHGFLRQLFGHEDPQALRRSLTYLGYLHRSRQREVARLKADRHRLAEVMAELEAEGREARRLEERLAAQKEALAARKADRERLLRRLEARARRQQERLADVRSDQEALKQVIGRLRSLRERGILLDVGDKHMAELKGRLPLPVKGGEVLARYGAPRQQESLRWRGLLLGARLGAEVRAIFRGRVAYAERLRGYGLITIIDHGDGLLSLYAHNRVLFKEVGEWVETGEVVAEVGKTGGRRRAATYFEVRRNGEPVDPLRWCRAPG